jgi:hypothetical protein
MLTSSEVFVTLRGCMTLQYHFVANYDFILSRRKSPIRVMMKMCKCHMLSKSSRSEWKPFDRVRFVDLPEWGPHIIEIFFSYPMFPATSRTPYRFCIIDSFILTLG